MSIRWSAARKQLDRVLSEIEEAPGIVLFTLLEKDLVGRLEAKCQEINSPSLSIIGPVMQLFQAYLGASTTGRVGAQHTLNAEYFKRIDALNYSMMHDDGQHVEGLEEADVVLVGVSRTSKTPTSIYLANRGVRTANVPLVPGIPIPHQLETLKNPLVVSLHATPERLIQIRQNRLLSIGSDTANDDYIDRQSVTDEVTYARKLSAKYGWALVGSDTSLHRGNRGSHHEAAGRSPASEDVRMTIWRGVQPLILASQSLARRELLANAGITFDAMPADIDERGIQQKSGLKAPGEIAALLAERKAAFISLRHPGRYVLGADQILALGDRMFSKPAGREQAAEQLAILAGNGPTNCIQRLPSFAMVRRCSPMSPWRI
jgi:regulator of PEP synthase PpsR (kinase-PPPase family)